MESLSVNPEAQQLNNVSAEIDSKIEGKSSLGPEFGESLEEVSHFSTLYDDAHESNKTAKTWVNPGETYGSYEEIVVSEDDEEVANLSTSVNSKEYMDSSAAASSHADEEGTATVSYDSTEGSHGVSSSPGGESQSGDSNNSFSHDVSSSLGDEDNTASTNDSSLFSPSSKGIRALKYMKEKSRRGYQHEESRDEFDSMNEGRTSFKRLRRRFKKGINLFDTDTVLRQTAGKDSPEKRLQGKSRDVSSERVSLKYESMDFNDQENLVREKEKPDITQLKSGRDAAQSTARGLNSDQKVLHESKIHETDENILASKSSSSSRHSTIDPKTNIMGSCDTVKQSNKKAEFFSNKIKDTALPVSNDVSTACHPTNDGIMTVTSDTQNHETESIVEPVIVEKPAITQHTQKKKETKKIVSMTTNDGPTSKQKVVLVRRINDRINNALKADGKHGHIQEKKKSSNQMGNNSGQPPTKAVNLSQCNGKIPAIEKKELTYHQSKAKTEKKTSIDAPVKNSLIQKQQSIEAIKAQPKDGVRQENSAENEADGQKKNTEPFTLSDFSPSHLVRKLLNSTPKKCSKERELKHLHETLNKPESSHSKKIPVAKRKLSDKNPQDIDVTSSTFTMKDHGKTENLIEKKSNTINDEAHITPSINALKTNEEFRIASSMPNDASIHSEQQRRGSKYAFDQHGDKDVHAECVAVEDESLDCTEGNLSIHHSLDEFEKIKRVNDGTITESHPLTKDLNLPEDNEREEFLETPNFSEDESFFQEQGMEVQNATKKRHRLDETNQITQKTSQYLPEAGSERVVETKASQNNISFDKSKTAKKNCNEIIKKGSFQAVTPYVPQSMQRNKDEVRPFGAGIREENVKSSSLDHSNVLLSHINKAKQHPAPVDNLSGKERDVSCPRKSPDEQKTQAKNAPGSRVSMTKRVEQTDITLNKYTRKVHGRRNNFFKGKAKAIQNKEKDNSLIKRNDLMKFSDRPKQNSAVKAVQRNRKTTHQQSRNPTVGMDKNRIEVFGFKDNENLPISQDNGAFNNNLEETKLTAQKTIKPAKKEKKKNSLTFGNPASGKNSEKLRPNNSSGKGDRKPTTSFKSKDNETLTSRENNDWISPISSNHLEQRFDMKAIQRQPDEEEEECNLSPLNMSSSLGMTEEELSSRDTVSEAQAVPSREHESQDSTEFFDEKILKEQGMEVQNVAGNLVISKAGSFPLEIFHPKAESQVKHALAASDKNRLSEPGSKSTKGLGHSEEGRPFSKLSLETGDARLADTFVRSNEAEQEMDKYFVNDLAMRSRSQPPSPDSSSDVFRHSKAAAHTFNAFFVNKNENSSSVREKIRQHEGVASEDKVLHTSIPSNVKEDNCESSLGKNKQLSGALSSKSVEVAKDKLITARLLKKSKSPHLKLSSDDMQLDNIRVHHCGSPGVSVALAENRHVTTTDKQPFNYMGRMSKGLKSAKGKFSKTPLWTKMQPEDHVMLTGDEMQGNSVARLKQSSNIKINKASGCNEDNDTYPVAVNKRKLPQTNITTHEFPACAESITDLTVLKAHDEGKAARDSSKETSVVQKNSSLSALKSSGNKPAEKNKHRVSDVAKKTELQAHTGLTLARRATNLSGELGLEEPEGDAVSQIRTKTRPSTVNLATDNSESKSITSSSTGLKKNSGAASLLRSGKEEKNPKKKNNVRFESSIVKEKEAVNNDAVDASAIVTEKKSDSCEPMTRTSVVLLNSPGKHEKNGSIEIKPEKNNSYSTSGVDVLSFVAKNLGADFCCTKLSSTLSHDSGNGQDEMKIYGDEEGHELTIDEFYLKSESEESTKTSIITNQTVNKVVGVVNASTRKSSKNTSSVKSRRQKTVKTVGVVQSKHPNAL